MKTLDCENFSTALYSLATIFELPGDAIKNALLTVDFESYTQNLTSRGDDIFFDGKYHDPDELSIDNMIYHYFVKEHNVSVSYDKVCWFHLARTFKPESYLKGIYPLGMVLDELYADLFAIASDLMTYSEWKEIKDEGSSGYNNWIYRMRINNPSEYGPYAMLIKELAFRSRELTNHDYLKIPEIIEDIVIGLCDKYNMDFYQRYSNATHSVIVKFELSYSECIEIESRSIDNPSLYLAPALYYVFNTLKCEPLSLMNNCCFSANNRVIPSESIKYVQIVPYKPQ